MKKLSLFAFASFLVLWGINLYIINNDDLYIPKVVKRQGLKKLPNSNVAENVVVETIPTGTNPENSDLLSTGNIREIDKIGDVVNSENVNLDKQDKEKIKVAKAKYDNEQNLREKVTILEQSFMDKNSSVKDIKRVQSDVQDLKTKMKLEIQNTEKWDPMFVYYLMISENYTYSEINQIQSLSENGISKDEQNYINGLIKQESFKQQVLSFKNAGDIGRAVANLSKKSRPKEKDEFVDSGEESNSYEEKLIEMNYGKNQKEESVY